MRPLRTSLVAALAVASLTLPSASSARALVGPTPPPADATGRDFNPQNFSSDSFKIDNIWLPLTPGTQFVMQGQANRGTGLLPHQVIFTVTDLTKVTEKYKGEKLLRQILEPSTEINEQFRAQVFQTSDGDVVTGVVVKEDGAGVHIVSNLLLPNEVRVLAKDKIAARKPSELSPMPTGMLVTLQKDEILDLVAYLESGGDSKHRMFGK